jgi:hypothetical protein
LQKADKGDVDAWWRLNFELAVDEDRDEVDEHRFDLTELPAWPRLEEATRERCLMTGMDYLRRADPADATWLGTNTFHRPAAAGYRALRLAAAMERDQLLIGLSADIWDKWIPSVLALWEDSGGEPVARALTTIAYRSAPEAVQRALARILSKADEHVARQALRKTPTAWPPELAYAMLAEIQKGTLSHEIVGMILSKAVLSLPQEGREFAMELVNRRHQTERNAMNARVAAASLLTSAPAIMWDGLWPILRGDDEFGRTVLEDLGEKEAAQLLNDLRETQLSELYLWLRKAIPNQRTEDDGRIAARDADTRLEDVVLQRLKTLGTEGAVIELRRIAKESPELWLKVVAMEAEDNWLRNDWAAVSIGELKRLGDDPRTRVIATDRQLLELVSMSCGRLQERLQGETPAVVDLWNDAPRQPRNEAHLSDYLKRHMELDLGGRAVVVNREVELRRADETDIRVDAVRSEHPRRVSVLVEVKGCWNDGVYDDMKTQLLDRYMRNSQIRCGLYVVGWYSCEAWDATDYRKKRTKAWTVDVARQYFQQQAHDLSRDGILIQAMVLDLALPG